MVDVVNVFRCSDGRTYKSAEAAERHEVRLERIKMFEELKPIVTEYLDKTYRGKRRSARELILLDFLAWYVK